MRHKQKDGTVCWRPHFCCSVNDMRERAGRGGSEEWPQLHEGEEAGGPARLWWREAAGSKDILDIEEGLRSGRETQSGVLSPGGLQDARPLSDGGWDRLLTHTRGGGAGAGHCGREAERPSAGDVGTERSWTRHSGKQGRLSPEARPPQDQLLAQSPDPLNTETFFNISRLQESRVSRAGMGRHPATPTRLPHRPEESADLSFTEPARPSKATLPGHCGVGWLPCSCFVPDDRLRGADPEAGSGPLFLARACRPPL